jgi:hypothetical protein
MPSTSVFAQPHLPALAPPFSANTAVDPSPLAPEEEEEEEGFTTVSRRGPHEVGASPLLHMKCTGHHFCEDCFYGALELAIDRESSHSIPCGEKACPSLEYEDVKAIFSRFTTLATSRRVHLLQQYAHPPALASSFTARPPERHFARAPTSWSRRSTSKVFSPSTAASSHQRSARLLPAARQELPSPGPSKGRRRCREETRFSSKGEEARRRRRRREGGQARSSIER